jgi:hypothetical protein
MYTVEIIETRFGGTVMTTESGRPPFVPRVGAHVRTERGLFFVKRATAEYLVPRGMLFTVAVDDC